MLNKNTCFWTLLGLILLFGCSKFISLFIALIIFIVINFYMVIAGLALVYLVAKAFSQKRKPPAI